MNTCTPRCTPVEFIHWSVNPKRHEFAFLIRTETTRNGEVEKGIEKNRRRNELKETPATQRKIPKNSQCKTWRRAKRDSGLKGEGNSPPLLIALHLSLAPHGNSAANSIVWAFVGVEVFVFALLWSLLLTPLLPSPSLLRFRFQFFVPFSVYRSYFLLPFFVATHTHTHTGRHRDNRTQIEQRTLL